MHKQTRRSFLQLAGAGAVAAGLPPVPVAAAVFTPKTRGAKEQGETRVLVDLVNPLQGTDSTSLFSRGNTLPIVAVPFGMGHWTLQTKDNGPWFFQPSERRIQGVRCTHQLSPWLSDYGYATFLPYSGETSADGAARASSYRPEDAVIRPYVLEMYLLRYRTKLELTPTERCAALRLTFEDAHAGLLIDLPGKDAVLQFKDGLLLGTVHANGGGVTAGFATYYVLKADVAFGAVNLESLRDRQVARVPFATNGTRAVVNVRIATSFISHEQALRNLKNEVEGKSFDDLKSTALHVWEQHLSRAVVEGGTHDQQQVFYSGMYRALLFPRIWHEPDATGKLVHWSPYTGKVTPGVMYADHGYWDVYRAWYPWMSILFPERLSEILQAWVNIAHEGGWLPQFPCPGYRACMTGSLIDAVFADAAVKEIGGFDLETAYRMLRKHATQPGDPDAGYGRRGIKDYLQLGYVAADRTKQSVAETVDSAYGDFCIAQVARVLGKDDEAKAFQARSANWKHLYDPETKFLRGKKADGTWIGAFDPVQWGDPYVEGSAWQHRWDVPHDPEGLMQVMGGHAYVAEQLELMLTQPASFHVGSYGREIHEMSEMAAVQFGQYAQSNQPVHHVLYLFALAGRPDRLQYWVRRVMTELYTPNVFPGDEDTGSMSAWFLMSAMGFYPFCPGKAEYVLGSPLFDRVTLQVADGAKTVIEAQNNGAENVYTQSIKLNGNVLNDGRIRHSDIRRGGRLEFSMGPKAPA
jgi:predicted alpha-1,2-mannosidase